MAEEKNTITVETTGDFMAQDPTNGQVIEAYGATEVQETEFIRAQIELGRLKESSSKDAKKADKPEAVEPLNPNPSLTEKTDAAAANTKKMADDSEGPGGDTEVSTASSSGTRKNSK